MQEKQNRLSWEERERRVRELLKEEGENPNAREDFERSVRLAAQDEPGRPQA